MFKRIVEKICSCFPNFEEDVNVALYNWTEPFLHPELVTFIGDLEKRKIKTTLSSNLALRNIEDQTIVDLFAHASLIQGIAVSLSGFTQEIYGKYHKGGDINIVKENMIKLSSLCPEKNAPYIEVKWLSFKYNQHEKREMENFVKDIGFNFAQHIASPIYFEDFFHDLEFNENINSQPRYQILLNEIHITKREIVPLPVSCRMIEQEMVIDCFGDVYLCCVTKKQRIGNFLEMSLEEIQHKKREHPFCQKCAQYGFNAV